MLEFREILAEEKANRGGERNGYTTRAKFTALPQHFVTERILVFCLTEVYDWTIILVTYSRSFLYGELGNSWKGAERSATLILLDV